MIFAPTKVHMHILFPGILQCIAINRKVMYHELIQKEIKIEYLLLITFQMTQIIILFHVKSSFCDLHDVNVKTTVDLLPRALKQNWVLSCHTFAVVLNWYFKKNKQDVTVLILCWCLSLTIIFILFMDMHLLQIGNLKYMHLFESC